MADESGDIDMGYVDDDIEIDDIDDEDLGGGGGAASGSSGAINLPTGAATAAMVAKKARKVGPVLSKAPAASIKKESDNAPREGDLYLRMAPKAKRDLILARFKSNAPPLQEGEVRFYRGGEGTERGRKRGLEEHAKDMRRKNSFVGRRKAERQLRSGVEILPNRVSKPWIMEIVPEGDDTVAAEGEEYPANASVWSGAYDGAPSAARYALFVMTNDNRTVDVVPVGEHAWFSFRNVRNPAVVHSTAAAEGKQEQRMNAVEKSHMAEKLWGKKRGMRFAKFEAMAEIAAERRENLQGGYSRFEAKNDIVPLGIRRKVNAKVEAEKLESGEGMEFEMEFDNNDVDLIDRDDKPKKDPTAATAKRPTNVRQYQEKIMKMIRDEPDDERKRPPGADSEDDDDDDTDRNRLSRSPSPERPPTTAGATASATATVAGNSRAVAASAAPARAGSRTGSRAGTPQPAMLDLRHLLPAPGTLPTREHVAAVIRALTTDRGRPTVNVKEVAIYFERNTPERKKNLQICIKSVSVMSVVMENGSKQYYVKLK